MTVRRSIRASLVEALLPGETVWDGEVRGFGVRRQRRDAVYIVKYRDREGRQRVWTIGRHGPGDWFPDRARKEAIRIKGTVRDGRDPAVARDQDKAASSLSDFAVRYVEHAADHKKPRTLAEDRKLLRTRILPVLGERRLSEIDRSDVARFHASMRSTTVGANRAVGLLSAMLGWAERVGERLDGSNPCKHVDRYPEAPRERYLSALELARLGDALDAADATADWRGIAAIRLLVLTGARRSEVLALKWEWIDAAQGVARLPDSKTGAKTLYLPPGALAVLSALPRTASNPYVLPGDRAGGHFSGIAKPWQRVRTMAALPDVRLHDLRHCFASVAVASGDSLYIVGKILGHRQAGTTARYAHLAPDPVRAVAARASERIADMMGVNRVRRAP